VVDSVLDDYAYATIRQKAQNKDVCLTFINSRSGEGTSNVFGNQGDRNNLTAWRDGDTLVKTVAAECKNTVVVIHSVGAIIVEPWIDHPNVTAVIMAHLPGEESGGSLVDVLWGAVNPSGKLPYTIAKEETDYCCKVQYTWTGFFPEQSFDEGLLVDYKWFDAKAIAPRFEFGYGLSYTNFTYASALQVSAPAALNTVGFTETVFTVTTSIANTGNVAGKEVAQLYISLPSSAPSGTPLRQLRGFEKVLVQPGETEQVAFVVTKRDLSFWRDDEDEWDALSGTYGIFVGASSRDFRATAEVVVSLS
jgi:hypothetical protein